MSFAPAEHGPPSSPPRVVATSGVIFSALYITSLILIRLAVPADPKDPGIWLADLAYRNWVRIALNLVPFTGIAFLWFMAVLRDRIGRREDKFFATVFMGSGLLFVGLFLAGAAAIGGLAAGARFGTASSIDATIVGYARSLGYTFLLVFATKAAGVFTIVTSTMLLRLAHWPR